MFITQTQILLKNGRARPPAT